MDNNNTDPGLNPSYHSNRGDKNWYSNVFKNLRSMNVIMYLKVVRYQIIFTVAIINLLVLVPLKLAIASINLTSLTDAINREVCFGSFWGENENVRLGKAVKIIARRDGNTTYAWSTDFSEVPGVTKWTDFITLVSMGNQFVVQDWMGFNTNLMDHTPLYKKNMKEISSPAAVNFELRLPTNCSPKFLPDNRTKHFMLNLIIKSLAEGPVLRNSSGTHSSHRIQVIIANFNINDPGTFAFIPSTKRVVSITLHDPDNPFSNIYLQLGGFPALDVSDTGVASYLIPRIMKFGKVYWLSN